MEAAENDEIKRGTRLKQGHTVPLLFKYETLVNSLPLDVTFPRKVSLSSFEGPIKVLENKLVNYQLAIILSN